MNHKPYEDWLLSGESLDHEQRRLLDEHLRGCMGCSTLAEVNLALQHARNAAPGEGFVGRFQVRLTAYKQAQRQRILWGVLVLVLGGLGFLLWFTWPYLTLLFNAPVELLGSWVDSLAALMILLKTTSGMVSVFLKVVPQFIPASFWLLVLLAFCGGSALWAMSMRKYLRHPKGV